MNIPLSESIPYYNSDFTKGIITLRGVSIDDDVWIKSGYQKNKPTK